MFLALRIVFTLNLVGCGLVIIPKSSAQEQDSLRTWTDLTAEFKVEATLEKIADGKVYLKRKDSGEVITVPLVKLSKDDQAYVRKLQIDQRKSGMAANSADSGSTDTSSTAAPDTPMVWQGTWNNRKYGTDGPLKCVAVLKDAKHWEAKFDGTGLGNPFNYQVAIETSKKGEKTMLQGTSNVDGDTYRWTGVVEGELMIGKYRSASGNNGEFRLKATAPTAPAN